MTFYETSSVMLIAGSLLLMISVVRYFWPKYCQKCGEKLNKLNEEHKLCSFCQTEEFFK